MRYNGYIRWMMVVSTTIVLMLSTTINPFQMNATADKLQNMNNSLGYGGEPIWIYDSDLYVRHVETADLNGDGVKDVIAGEYSSDYYDTPSKVYGIDGTDGSTLWSYSLNDGVRSMTLGDVNNDGVMDAIAGASKGSSTPDGKVHAIDGTDGTEIWTFTPGDSGDTNGDVAVGNFDGDEYADVAVACWDDYVYAINGSNGNQLWQTYIGSIFLNAVDTGDINGDGIDDVAYAHEYLSGYNNYFGVLDGTDGSKIWEKTFDEGATAALIADVDDDGSPEIVAGRADGKIIVYDTSGNEEWNYTCSGEVSVLDVYDIDDDADVELIVGTLGNRVYAFEGNTPSPLWESSSLNGDVNDIAFGDVTGDGTVNIIAAGAYSDRVHVLDATDGSLVWYYSVAGTLYGVGCADFNSDGVKDVAAGGGAESSGSPPDPAKSVWALKTVESPLLWEFDFGEYGNAIAIDDLNNDQYMDVVAVCSSDDKTWAINGEDGTELWNWTGTENLYAVTTGDFNGDGQIDVAVAGYDEKVTALDGLDGSIMWEFTEPNDQIYRKCLHATDLNNDGKIDVVAGCDDGKIYAINGNTGSQIWVTSSFGGDIEDVDLAQMDNHGPLDVVAAVGSAGNKAVVINGSNGELLWEYTQNTEYARQVDAFDVNNDGNTDIVVGMPKMGSTPGRIIMVDGVTHTAIWTTQVPVGYEYTLDHGDLNGDGVPDVVVGGNSDSKKVYAYNGNNGELMWSFLTGGEVNCVLVEDVDNNGILDVVAGSDDQQVYVLSGSSGKKLWSYSTADDVMHIQVGDISGDNEPNIAAITFGFDGIVYAFASLVGKIPLEADADGPYEGMVNTSIQFYGSATGGYPPYSWHWDFGDGATSDEQNPEHVYTNAGSYTAKLTVTDNTGNTSTDTSSVTVYDHLTADADGPYTGMVGDIIQFNGSATGGKPPYGWHWDFGDGVTSDEQNPQHVYFTAGIYTVTLTVTDDIGNQANDTSTATISPQPLEADADGPYEGTVGETISFHGYATGGVQPYSWHWDFGDGHTSDEKDPQHIYTISGTFTVTLTVTDSLNSTDTDTTTAVVHGVEEVVADANGPYEGVAGEPIQFHGSATGGKPPYTYYWEFGDGVTSDEQNPLHVYENPGQYTVTLTVTDALQRNDSDSTVAMVYSTGEVVADADGPYTGFTGETIQFHGSAVGGTPPYTYHWEFGDGATSDEQNPTHVYSTPGTFMVHLTVTDSENRTDADETSVTVKEDNEPPVITIIKPEINSLYLFNKRLIPFVGTLIIGYIDVETNVTDDGMIDHVEFYVDDSLKNSVDTEPYTWSWSEKTFGRHALKIVAYDRSGKSTSEELKVFKIL